MGTGRARGRALLARLRREIDASLEEDHTPRQVAASFALGVFITALPTLGLGLILFVVVAALVASVSKIALFASVLVLNPVVKWGVYAASFWLGSYLLGPVPGVGLSGVSLDAGPAVVHRLLLGNLVIAVVLTVVAYVGAYRLTVGYRRGEVDLHPIEETVEDLVERLPEE